jgi:hypothetical protein
MVGNSNRKLSPERSIDSDPYCLSWLMDPIAEQKAASLCKGTLLFGSNPRERSATSTCQVKPVRWTVSFGDASTCAQEKESGPGPVMLRPRNSPSTGTHIPSCSALPSGPSAMGAGRPLPSRGPWQTASTEPRPAHRPKPLQSVTDSVVSATMTL